MTPQASRETYSSESEQETFEIGFRFGRRLHPPAVVLLRGGLGAGKTVFTRGLTAALGLGAETVVRSPSFSLVNLYETPVCPVYHVDLYRLGSSRDLLSIGLEEILSVENAVVVIEWAEKLSLPLSDALSVDITVDVTSGRRLIEIADPLS